MSKLSIFAQIRLIWPILSTSQKSNFVSKNTMNHSTMKKNMWYLRKNKKRKKLQFCLFRDGEKTFCLIFRRKRLLNFPSHLWFFISTSKKVSCQQREKKGKNKFFLSCFCQTIVSENRVLRWLLVDLESSEFQQKKTENVTKVDCGNENSKNLWWHSPTFPELGNRQRSQNLNPNFFPFFSENKKKRYGFCYLSLFVFV